MSYSFRVAAATRNQRVAAGHKRLLRLRGIPTTRFRKCRLVLGGVFPQALHACEASWVPVSVFGRLRSKVVQALNVEGSGVNPFLATNICAPANVDPQFAALLSRLRLFRQLWRDFPVYRPILLARLASTGSKFKTPTDHLVRALQDLGWECLEGLCFQDEAGRSFSLVSSSLRHIRSLLAFQWGRYIAGQVSHRKGLASLQAVDIEFSRPSKSLLPSERGLLGQLVCGRNFTCDSRSKFAGATCDSKCPHCGKAEDSRAHRVYDCPAFERVDGTIVTFSSTPRSLRCCLVFGPFRMVWSNGKPPWTPWSFLLFLGSLGLERLVSLLTALAFFLRFQISVWQLGQLLHQRTQGIRWSGQVCCQLPIRRSSGPTFFLVPLRRGRHCILL